MLLGLIPWGLQDSLDLPHQLAWADTKVGLLQQTTRTMWGGGQPQSIYPQGV